MSGRARPRKPLVSETRGLRGRAATLGWVRQLFWGGDWRSYRASFGSRSVGLGAEPPVAVRGGTTRTGGVARPSTLLVNAWASLPAPWSDGAVRVGAAASGFVAAAFVAAVIVLWMRGSRPSHFTL